MTNEELLQIVEMTGRYKLDKLDLSHEDATDLPHEVSKWSILPDEIGKLSGLKELNISGNGLDKLSDKIGELDGLEILCLNNNKIATIPHEILRLKNLKKLYIRANLIETIPSEIGALVNLTTLDLARNCIAELPPEIGKLSNLARLSLESNRLKSLPPEIGNLKKLEHFFVEGNPLVSPPPEIVDMGTRSILNYIEAVNIDSYENMRAGLFIMGKAGAGKRTLLDSLNSEDQSHDLSELISTSIDSLTLTYRDKQDAVLRLDVCDFGELELFHATHKYLFTNRTVFMIVLNAYYGFEHARLYEMLDMIQVKAPKSPVFIVSTHIDVRHADLPTVELRAGYPNISGFYQVSNVTGKGIDALKKALCSTTVALPLIGEAWPASWLQSVNAIEVLNEKYIDITEALEILKSCGVNSGHAQTVLRWFHELGIVIYFFDDRKFNNIVFLKPDWVSNVIINALDSGEVIDNMGRFSQKEAEVVWEGLDRGIQNSFMQLMQKLELAFLSSNNKEEMIVAERLPVESRGYLKSWDKIATKRDCREITMSFYFNADIPPGAPSWFIARGAKMLTGFYWQTGALFRDDDKSKHLALIQIRTHERCLRLAVRGPYPWNFFGIIRDGLELIFKRFPGLQIERRIPCECGDGKGCDYEHNYKQLYKRVLNKTAKNNIECPESFDKVSVPYLIFGLDHTSHKSILSRIDKLKAKSLDAGIDATGEIDSLIELTQREFLKQFNYIQKSEETQCPNVFAFRLTNDGDEFESIENSKLALQLYCQAPGCWHPVQSDGYPIENAEAFFNATAPYISKLALVLRYVSPVIGKWVNQDKDMYKKTINKDINLINKLAGKLQGFRNLQMECSAVNGYAEMEIYRYNLAALRTLLAENGLLKQWGGLKMIETPEGHYLWLCNTHASEYDLFCLGS